MKKFVISIFILLFYVSFSQSDTTHLIFDEPYNSALPRNFRISDGGLKRSYEKMPDTAGLGALGISGSAEFNNLNLPVIINTIGTDDVIIVDLRQETHGFVNGMSISWYGRYDWADLGLSREEVIILEKHKLDSLKKNKTVTVTYVLQKNKPDDTFIKVKDSTFEAPNVLTEEELTKKYGINYFRITATDHRKPTNWDVDLFLDFVSRLSSNYHLHFHCHAGDGRTTTFMAMYDMMRNAKSVSFDDIIERQYLIGGINLSKDEDFPSYDKQYAIERTAFLKDFHSYCKANADGFKTNYSAWLKK
jgi:hypothetical protein